MISRNTVLALVAATALAGTAMQPLMAQGYYGPPQGGYAPPPSYDEQQRAYQQGIEDQRRADEERRREFERREPDRRDFDRRDNDRRDYDRQAQYGASAGARCEEKRDTNTAGGAIIGAIAGGLLGNSVSGHDRGAGTAIGAIAGGVLGASIGRSLTCQNQQYAYKVYYSGFETGRPHHRYDWRSPYDSSYGYLDVGDYYTGPEGYRCANYTQRIWVNGRPEVATGHACRRPDGTWQMVG